MAKFGNQNMGAMRNALGRVAAQQAPRGGSKGRMPQQPSGGMVGRMRGMANQQRGMLQGAGQGAAPMGRAMQQFRAQQGAMQKQPRQPYSPPNKQPAMTRSSGPAQRNQRYASMLRGRGRGRM
jgi:hypothetical protein